MSSLLSRVEAAIRKIRGTASERSYVHAVPTDLSWPDVIALARDAEQLRIAVDTAIETYHRHGGGAFTTIMRDLEAARGRSSLYRDDGPGE